MLFAPSTSQKRREGSRKKKSIFIFPKWSLISLTYNIHILGFAGRGGGAQRGVGGLEQEVQHGLKPLQVVQIVASSPPAVGLGEAVQLGTPCQGWAHTLVPRTHIFISVTVHRQDLSTGSFLLVPLKCCYRNQNPQ